MRKLVGPSYLDILAHKTIGLLNYYFFVGNKGNIQSKARFNTTRVLEVNVVSKKGIVVWVLDKVRKGELYTHTQSVRKGV
jgi:hypothetical protein